MRKFFIKVNENQVYREEFLNNPGFVLNRDLGISIDQNQENQINQIKGIVFGRARRIPRDVPALEMINAVKGATAADMPDDSVIL